MRGRERQEIADRLASASVLDLFGSRHRIVAHVSERVLATDLRNHCPFLVQDADGSIQLPALAALLAMVEAGDAHIVDDDPAEASAAERMRAQIDLLNAGNVKQGEKAIWIYLEAHWTAALAARFGPYDQPWKIRRWRAALRKSKGERRPADHVGMRGGNGAVCEESSR